MAAKQSQKPFKQRTPKGPKPLPDGNPAAFRTWYVPDGVSTGPTGHRNAGPGGRGQGQGQGRPYAKPRPAGAGAGAGAGQGRGPSQGQQRKAHPYGHPGNAPSFPSDHATPGFNPYGAAPRAARPAGGQKRGPGPGGRPGGGNRPAGGRPPGGGGRPGGGGNRGPRGG